MQAVYRALLAELATRRWAHSLTPVADVPRAGLRYRQDSESGRRRGRVLEVRPPLRITLREVMEMGNCRLAQLLRFQLAPLDRTTAVTVDMRYQPDGLARLRIDAWHRWLLREQQRTFIDLGKRLETTLQGAGVSGHSQGSSSITVANITRVRGRPIFR